MRWRGFVLPLGAMVLAEVALRIHPTQSDAIAMPSQIIGALARAVADGSLLLATMQTMLATLAGLLLGGGLGLLTGVWFGLSRRAAERSNLLVQLLRPIPSVALIPVAMLVFGFGFRLEIFVVAFAIYFPMSLLTQSAVAAVPGRLIEVSRVLGLSMQDRVRKIVLPAALPRVFVGVRLCIGIALVVAVTTEIASNPQGLGYALVAAQQSLAPDLMLAVLLWVGVLGWGVNALLVYLQGRWFANLLPAGGKA
jgi:NitT/TauT family transport system permease protein